MKKSVKTLLSVLFAASLPFSAVSANDNISKTLAEVGLNVQEVKASPMPGVAQVLTDQGLFFMSEDGRYLIAGNVLDLQQWQTVRGQRVPTNLKDQLMAPIIQQKLAEQKDQVIEYKAPKEKYVVHVFTDPSCGYCRKLHQEMKDYHNAGITVRYLAYPRAGVGSETGLQMQHVWCAKNKNAAMDNAKADKAVAKAMCQNPVASQYALGQFFGINGTPAMILPDGNIIPGYMPAAALLQQLSSGG